MPRMSPQRLIPWLLATFAIGVMKNAPTAGSFTRGCAARDFQIQTMSLDLCVQS